MRHFLPIVGACSLAAALACGGFGARPAPPPPPPPLPAPAPPAPPPVPQGPSPGTVLGTESLPLPTGEHVFGVAFLGVYGPVLVTADKDTRIRAMDVGGGVAWEHTFASPAEMVAPSNPLALPGSGMIGFGSGGSVTCYTFAGDGGPTRRVSLPHVDVRAAVRQGGGYLATGGIDTRAAQGGSFDFGGQEVDHIVRPHQAFVARFDTSCEVARVTPLEAGEGVLVAADDAGNAYAEVTGTKDGSALYRVAPSGTVLWSVPMPGIDAVTADGSGAPWVAGSLAPGKTLDWLGLSPPPHGPCASHWGFVARLDPSDGSLAWARSFSGPIRAIRGLEGDAVAVAGTAPTRECHQTGFVRALSPTGDRWHTDLGPDDVYPWAMDVTPDEIVVYGSAQDVDLSVRKPDAALAYVKR